MPEKRETKTDGDEIECPCCGHMITDLWDFNWRHDSITTSCCECGKDVEIYRNVSVSYTAYGEPNV